MLKTSFLMIIFFFALLPVKGYSYNTLGRRWSGDFPTPTYQVNANFADASAGSPEEQRRAVREGAERWNVQGRANFAWGTPGVTTISSGVVTSSTFCDRHSVVFARGGNSPWDSSTSPRILAEAQSCIEGSITFNGRTYDVITEADVVFWDGWTWTPAEIADTAAHEMGHALGLDHSSENPSESSSLLANAVMYYLVNSTDFINADDRAGIQSLYGRVPNGPPIANAGPDQSRGIGETVFLNGSSSRDFDGDTITYSWSQMAGSPVILSSSTSATPTFTLPTCFNAGTVFTFELTVRDPSGLTASDRVDIRVSDSDPDRDGLNNSDECAAMSNPRQADSDGDGINDGAEAHGTWMGAYMCPTNPASRDSDGDGLSDGDEINRYRTNPCNRNTDGDCEDDNVEVAMAGRNPTVSESAEIQVNANSLSFSEVNHRGSLRNIEVRNAGVLPLQIMRVAVEGAGFSAGSLPTSLGMGVAQNLQVLFSPAALGSSTGNLRIESNDCRHSPLNITLSANGLVSNLSVMEERLDYNLVPLRNASRQVIHLSNPNSNRALKVTLSTEDPAFYPARLIQEIAPGATVEMGVYFKPYRYGTFETKLKIKGFYANNAQTREVVLRGFGEAEPPQMQLSAANVNFGNAALSGAGSLGELRVRNMGSNRLYIYRVDVLNESGEFLDAENTAMSARRVWPNEQRFVVEPGQERVMHIRFRPHALGELRGRLKLYYNTAPGMATTEINFQGVGTN